MLRLSPRVFVRTFALLKAAVFWSRFSMVVQTKVHADQPMLDSMLLCGRTEHVGCLHRPGRRVGWLLLHRSLCGLHTYSLLAVTEYIVLLKTSGGDLFYQSPIIASLEYPESIEVRKRLKHFCTIFTVHCCSVRA
ncbi:hypothetical protein CYLTODRAFT_89141 [Cylindrobasidium torrendii FP15055 ss-10]|uniref:Secreted protein n=1 Tax=Cylindrobasidium torrendii FP15055 ss-10 TaxID=1314674 RepID=A0A0D7B1W7_9AGAR|nr:hypothetical protein CYLTODRAFT_89141 [Cylindrobasidium torrendii FP15055 ss-10]